MSETSFKIKCSKSSSARRFSLSKPTLAALSSHVEASWGASGPSFWYVDDDGDRIEVLDDNDFQATSSQLRSSCICLNVDFVSDQIEFKPSKNHDSLASSSSETSHEDDGFISVELHGDAPLLPAFVPHDVTASSDTHAPGSEQEQNSDDEGLVRDHLPQFHEASSPDIAQIETEREDQVQDAAHVAYLGKIATAVQDMVTSSAMGFTPESFRAAVESADAESLKLIIRNALLLSSCVSQVQAIARTAIMRMEHCMAKSLQPAPAPSECNLQSLMERLSISDMPHTDLHAWLKYRATREQLSCLSVSEERYLKAYACKVAREERRGHMLAAKLEKHLMTRPSAEQLKQAHIIVEPADARVAALERSMIAQRIESQLVARNKVASRFAGCVSAAHPICDTSSAEYAHQCHREQSMREMERAQVAATIERNLATRHSLRELKKAHIVVAPVEARAAALERTMNAKRLEKDLALNRSVVPCHSGIAAHNFAAAAQEDSASFHPDSVSTEQVSQLPTRCFSWASLAGAQASACDFQNYASCSATLEAMGFEQTEALRRAIVTHNGDVNAVLQHVLG